MSDDEPPQLPALFLDVQITRRKAFHVLESPEGEVLGHWASMNEALPALNHQSITELYIVSTEGTFHATFAQVVNPDDEQRS